MAEGSEERSREDLTEEASPYRLEEFRQKGMVAQSREVSGLVALLAAGATMYALSPTMGKELAEFMREVFRTDLSARVDLGGKHVLHGYMIKGLGILAVIGLPVGLAGLFLGGFSSFAQIGSIFTTEPLTPDLKKINPLEGIKRMFSMKHAMESARVLLKLTAVMVVCYGLVKGEILNSPKWVEVEAEGILSVYAQVGKAIFLALIGVLSVFAGIDFAIQRWDYQQKLRMTKQEAKREHREREGDPMIKARIKSIQREMSRKRMMAAVKTADVVVTNPTHIAIALAYDKNSMAAPKVVAKGADLVAQRIKQIAAEAGVPLVENVPLARTLYKTVKLNQSIPRALYQAVAEVLAHVYRLKRKDFV